MSLSVNEVKRKENFRLNDGMIKFIYDLRDENRPERVLKYHVNK